MSLPGVQWPAGTVTMLFTDIEGSTAGIQALGSDRWEEVLEVHAEILRTALATNAGIEVRTEGDSFFAVFTSATAAIAAAVAAQRGLQSVEWPHGAAVRVRMGLHTGETRPATTAAGADYVGFEVHRAARIAAAGHGGQVLISDTTRALVHDQLGAGIGLRDLGEHRFKDLAQQQRVYQLLVDGLPDDFPPLRSLDATPNNLPTQTTSFVGREPEIAKALGLLDGGRLLTLTGSGGTGKTRLALQVTASALDHFSAGAWLVELAPVTNPGDVAATVAAALHVSERAGHDRLATISESLRSQELLLVLDNCEHLIESCAQLADVLLRSCPRLKIIATSRERLNVPGETLMPVPSLRLPEPGEVLPLDELWAYEAVRLFVDRAAAFQLGFELTGENADDIVRICRRLDGIPLALELAAARVRALSLGQVAQRLDDRFRLLTGGGRTVVARQQTLRALIDWSYDLLRPAERTLLARLAVFARGWTLEAAEEICAGDGLERDEILDLLAHLVDKSLAVKQERAGSARYTMLETVREYAHDKLVESGEAAIIRKRHFDHFFRLLEQAGEVFGGIEGRRLAGEYENLLAALAWVEAESGSEERMLYFAGSLQAPAMWRGRGPSELRQILTRALERSNPTARTPGRARALTAAAGLASMQEDGDAAFALATEAAGILREFGNTRDLAQVLMILGLSTQDPAAFAEAESILTQTDDYYGLGLSRFIRGDFALQRGDYQEARRLHTESLALLRRAGDDSTIRTSPMLSLARIACAEGDFVQARALVEEALAIRRKNTDDHWAIAIALNGLGEVDRCEGRAAQAAPLFEQALRDARELGDGPLISWSQHNLGHVALQASDLPTAAGRLHESLTLRRRAGPHVNLATSLAAFAGLATRDGAFTEAAWLFGAAETMLESVHGVLPPADELTRLADLALVRARLDSDAFEAATSEGRNADLDGVDRLTESLAQYRPRDLTEQLAGS
ncbi:MAG: tetratricopeptide repeat protein [Chloroflexota bacterium]|nr:tetratricopeptide repeat protein [Chloroflexota bacterium]